MKLTISKQLQEKLPLFNIIAYTMDIDNQITEEVTLLLEKTINDYQNICDLKAFLQRSSPMIKVLMVCHGNICRSPMAEFLLKDMVAKRGIASQFDIASAATSREEIGNPVHHGTRKKLAQFGISVAGKTARQMTRRDYENYDYIIAMDRNNLRNIDRIIGSDEYNKVSLLLDFAGRNGQSIADPWYTGDFDITYDDIKQGLDGFLEYLGY